MIEFSHDKDAIPLADLVQLFARGANWKMPLAQDDWRDLLRHSPLVVTAWKDEQLVGFARLLTDFVRYANFYDVVVDPSFQRQGIGSQLVQRLLDHPRVARVRTVWLGTAEGHGFYERFGFVRDGNGHGMLLVRRDRDDQLVVGPQLAEVARIAPTDVRVARPSFIISSSEVPEEPGQYPGTTEVLSHGRPIGAAAGLQRLGLHVERLPSGHRTSFPHAHEDEEEFVYVIDGEVDAWIDGILYRMVAGDLAAFPAGTGIAHTLINRSGHEATLLVGGEKSTGQGRIHYPLNPERRERMRPGRWWDDAPVQALGAHDAQLTSDN
ncbi:GNAT family N-acetyltransferase [Vulgatibacter sp.]|uniref:GNAT family N-acetyltransferase n=1 Tax=Vulgatibacter sp. TaxID=1971226 RepID=UPI003567091E